MGGGFGGVDGQGDQELESGQCGIVKTMSHLKTDVEDAGGVKWSTVCWSVLAELLFSVCMSVSVSFLEKLYCSKGVIPAIILQVSAPSGSAVVVRKTSKRTKNGVHLSAGGQGVGAK